MIFGPGGTYFDGYSYSSAHSVRPLGLRFSSTNPPSYLDEFRATVSVGEKLTFDSVNPPTLVFSFRVRPSLDGWTITETDNLEWFSPSPWVFTETDNIYWSPDGLIAFREIDSITWNVRPDNPGSWVITETDRMTLNVLIDGTREGCITGDGEVNTSTPILSPMIW